MNDKSKHQILHEKYLELTNKYDKLKKDNELLLIVHKKILNDDKVRYEYSECMYDKNKYKAHKNKFIKNGYNDIDKVIKLLQERDDIYDEINRVKKEYNKTFCEYVNKKYRIDNYTIRRL